MACIDCGDPKIPWVKHWPHDCPLLPGDLKRAEREAAEAIRRRDIFRAQMAKREAERKT